MAKTKKRGPYKQYVRKTPYVNPGNVGRPKHEPTPLSRGAVKLAMAIGKSQEEVCGYLSVDRKTLALHYREEIDKAKFEVDLAVGKSLVDQATGGGASGKGDWSKAVPSMTKFYASTRMGLKETVVNEHSGIDGAAIKIETLTDAQLDILITRLEGRVGGAAEDAGDGARRTRAKAKR